MTDFSPELLAAREALLQGSGRFQVAMILRQPLIRPAYPVTVEAATAVCERYRVQWVEAQAEKAAALAEAVASKRSPGDGYWKREHRARALYGAALAFLEAMTDEP
jgi:hypothetical protein